MNIVLANGADIRGLDLAMQPVMRAAGLWREKQGLRLVVTSGLEGAHSPASLHYYGRAVDFRTNDLTIEQAERFTEFVKKAVGDNYDVILEKTHLHVEYDPKWMRP